MRQCEKATPKGFEPSRAEPSGFLVHLLNHSDTVSSASWSGEYPKISRCKTNILTLKKNHHLQILKPKTNKERPL
jgi:hypothetical protein